MSYDAFGFRHIATIAVTLGIGLSALLWFAHTPGQDHFGSISLDGDGSWYQNYDPAGEIQDPEIFWHGIGHSIENAQKADIIFLGASTLIFGIDWRLQEEFEKKHHIKMFNMGFVGIGSGQFSLMLIRKWRLHPKLWIIESDLHKGELKNSFFSMNLPHHETFGQAAPDEVVKDYWLHGLKDVVVRNIRWRVLHALGKFQRHDPYRSAVNGNMYFDRWPFQLDNNALIKPWDNPACENAGEVPLARHFLDQIGGTAILIGIPSVISCAQRIEHLSAALDIPGFAVAPEEFSSGDGGGHLDRKGARKYTAMLFAWLERNSALLTCPNPC